MIIGQDECTFKQFIFPKGLQVCPNKYQQLLLKEEGAGIMLCLFVVVSMDMASILQHQLWK